MAMKISNSNISYNSIEEVYNALIDEVTEKFEEYAETLAEQNAVQFYRSQSPFTRMIMFTSATKINYHSIAKGCLKRWILNGNCHSWGYNNIGCIQSARQVELDMIERAEAFDKYMRNSNRNYFGDTKVFLTSLYNMKENIIKQNPILTNGTLTPKMRERVLAAALHGDNAKQYISVYNETVKNASKEIVKGIFPEVEKRVFGTV